MRCSTMDKTAELFCLIDDFCQQFEPLLEQRLLGDSSDKQRHTAEQAAGLHVAVRDDHDCGAVSHHARAVVQGVLPGNRLPFHDLGVFPPAVIYPLGGPDAALCGGAGGLVRRTQGRLHGHFHCRLNATGRLSQFAHPTTALSCTPLSTLEANCLAEIRDPPRACLASPQTTSVNVCPNRSALARSGGQQSLLRPSAPNWRAPHACSAVQRTTCSAIASGGSSASRRSTPGS